MRFYFLIRSLLLLFCFNLSLAAFCQLEGEGLGGDDIHSDQSPLDADELAQYAQAWIDGSLTFSEENVDALTVLRGGSSVSHTGGYNYHLPLATPRGSGVSTPLSVGYSSVGGNGTLGVGWSLNLPFPLTLSYGYEGRMEHGHNARSTNDKHFYWSGGSLIETYDTGIGAVTTDGSQSEYRVSGMPTVLVKLYYKPDLEDLDPEDYHDYYAEVHLGSGIKLLYGLQRWGITLADGKFGGWMLDRVEDAHGKHIQFSYDVSERAVPQEDGTMVDATSEILLHQIHYTGLTSNAIGPNQITIHYEGRSDANTTGYGSFGYVHDLTQRISEIVLSVSGEQMRSYQFNYTQSPLTGKSLLSEITSCIPDGSCLDPLSFDYSDDAVVMEEEAGEIEGTWGNILRTSQHRLSGDFLNTGGTQVAFLKEQFKDPMDWSVPDGDANDRSWQLWDLSTGDVTSTFVPGVLSQGALYSRLWSHPEDLFGEEKKEQLVFGQVGFQPFAGELDPQHPGTEVGVPVTCPCWPDENATPLALGGDQLPPCSEYTSGPGSTGTDINYQHAFGLLIIRFYGSNGEVSAEPTYHAFTEPANQVHHADMDGDGVLDLILSSGYDFKDSKWVISQNRSSQSTQGREFVDAVSDVRSSVNDEVVLFDEDGDGLPELLYINAYSEEIHEQPGQLGEWVDAEVDYFVAPYPADVSAYYGRMLLTDNDPSKHHYKKLELLDRSVAQVQSYPTNIQREIVHSLLGNDERGMNAYFKANRAEDDPDQPWRGWEAHGLEAYATGSSIGGRIPLQAGDINGDGLQDYLVLRSTSGGLLEDNIQDGASIRSAVKSYWDLNLDPQSGDYLVDQLNETPPEYPIKLVPYLSRGNGDFEEGGSMWAGNSVNLHHVVQYWYNVGTLYDINNDGKDEFLVPNFAPLEPGEGGNWRVLSYDTETSSWTNTQSSLPMIPAGNPFSKAKASTKKKIHYWDEIVVTMNTHWEEQSANKVDMEASLKHSILGGVQADPHDVLPGFLVLPGGNPNFTFDHDALVVHRRGSLPDKLTTVTDSYGIEERITYSHLGAPDDAHGPIYVEGEVSTPIEAPFGQRKRGFVVTRTVEKELGLSHDEHTAISTIHTYGDQVTFHGRSLGYQYRKTERKSNLYSEWQWTHNQWSFDKALGPHGKVYLSQSDHYSQVPQPVGDKDFYAVKHTERQYQTQTVPNDEHGYSPSSEASNVPLWFTRPQFSRTKRYMLKHNDCEYDLCDETDLGAGQEYNWRERTNLSYDDYGHETGVTLTNSDGDEVTYEKTYQPQLHNWIIHRLTDREREKRVAGSSEVNHSYIKYKYTNEGQLRRVERMAPSLNEYLRLDVSRDALGFIDTVTFTGEKDAYFMTYEYNTDGYLEKVKDARGLTLSYLKHHPWYGNLGSIDANGLTQEINKDLWGNVVNTAAYSLPPNMPGSKMLGYPSMIYRERISDPTQYHGARIKISNSRDGYMSSSTYYDAMGRRVFVEWQHPFHLDGDLVRIKWDRDSRGRVTYVTNPYLESQGLGANGTHSYNWDGPMLVSATTADQSTWKYKWDPAAGEMTFTDPNKLPWKRFYSSLGKIKRVRDAEMGEVSYEYGPHGVDAIHINRANEQLTTGARLSTTIARDAIGRVISVDDPQRGLMTRTLDSFGRTMTHTDAEGRMITFSYDSLGRPDTVFYAEGTTRFIWDEARWGSLKTISADDIMEWMDYDEYGRPTNLYTHLPGQKDDYSFGMEYDDYGRLSVLKYPRNPDIVGSGLSVKYNYGSQGLNTSITNTADTHTYWELTDMTLTGQPKHQRKNNGLVEETHTWHPHGNELLSHQVVSGPSVYRSVGYEWDAMNRLESQTNQLDHRMLQYEYDDIGQLTEYKVTEHSFLTHEQENIAYDNFGGIVSRTGAGAYATDPLTGRPTMVDGVARFYNDAGQLTSTGDGKTMDWTSWSRPRSIMTPDGSVTYRYNAGTRAIKEEVSTTGEGNYDRVKLGGGMYQYTEWDSEWDPATIEERYRLMSPYGNVAEVSLQADGSMETRYLHNDHQGSPAVVTDETGSMVSSLQYSPWGDKIWSGASWGDPLSGEVGADVGYTGHEQAVLSGLVNMGARHYDAGGHVMMSADPMFSVNKNSPTGYNAYAYVLNNPVMYTDPTGMYPVLAASDQGYDDFDELDIMYVSEYSGYTSESNSSGIAFSGRVGFFAEPGSGEEMSKSKGSSPSEEKTRAPEKPGDQTVDRVPEVRRSPQPYAILRDPLSYDWQQPYNDIDDGPLWEVEEGGGGIPGSGSGGEKTVYDDDGGSEVADDDDDSSDDDGFPNPAGWVVDGALGLGAAAAGVVAVVVNVGVTAAPIVDTMLDIYNTAPDLPDGDGPGPGDNPPGDGGGPGDDPPGGDDDDDDDRRNIENLRRRGIEKRPDVINSANRQDHVRNQLFNNHSAAKIELKLAIEDVMHQLGYSDEEIDHRLSAISIEMNGMSPEKANQYLGKILTAYMLQLYNR